MHHLQLLIGRILICFIFLYSGINKILHFSANLPSLTAHGIPYVKVALVVAIVIEVGGALMLILGYQARLFSLAIFIYLAIVSFLYHIDFSNQQQTVQLLKNLAIMGGLLYIAACGTGRISVNKKGS